jgi:hypothetical protein
MSNDTHPYTAQPGSNLCVCGHPATHPTHGTPTPRDIIANWFKGDDQPYNHADSIIMKLWQAGYRIARSRYPQPDERKPATHLFLALAFPGLDPATTDPDALADDIAAAVNESFAADSGQVMVSGIPGPQWLTPQTLDNLRKAANP